MGATVRITSVKNPVVRNFREAAAGKAPNALVADGLRLVDEALDAGRRLLEVVTSPRLVTSERGRALRRRLLSSGVASKDCADAVLERISCLTTHQGVAALVERPAWTEDDLLGQRALLLVAAGVRDPGNLGALVRTAEAAGATGLIALHGGADPFREKAVRGSAGSIFRLPVLGSVPAPDALALLRRARVRVVVAEAGAERDYLDVDLGGPVALVLGGEAGGVPEWLQQVDPVRARVPMRGPVDSLNVAVTAGVLLYEARRQRL